MSEMSEKQLPQPPLRRRQIIKENTASHTNAEIARICGVTERTIDRDIAEMKESGEWTEWLEATLLDLMRDGELSDAEKFREIAKLYGKTLTTKSESRIEASGPGQIIVTFDKTLEAADDPGSKDSVQGSQNTETVPPGQA